MLNFLILITVFSTPTELLKNASRSIRQHDLVEAQQYLDSAKKVKLSDFEKARFFHNQAYVYDRHNNLSEALINYYEALRFLESSGNKSDDARYMLTWVNTSIGRIYYHYSNHELAIKYYNESLKHATNQEKSKLIYNIALSQSRLGLTKEATEGLLEAFKICVEYDQTDLKADIQIKIGTMLRESHDYDTSLKYLSDALSSDTLSSQTLAKAHNNFAITAWKMNDFVTAQKHFEHTIDIGDPKYQFVALQNLAEMYVEQGLYYKSIDVGSRAVEQFPDQINNPENLKLFTYLSNAYEAIGDFQSALAYSNKFEEKMVSYYDQQMASADSDDAYWIQMVTENYFKEVEAQEDRKKSLQANIIITSIILITFISLIWYQQSKKQKMVKKIAEELLA